MELMNKPPLWKVVLSRAAASTRAYDNTRITKISQRETPSGDSCELVFMNHDGALTSIDFEHYQAVISYGYKTGVSRSDWVAGSTYAIDDMVIPAGTAAKGYQYRCSVAGTAAASQPTWSQTLGITVADSTITWETDGLSGDEYSRAAPLRVRVQELHSGRGILKVILRPEGMFNQLTEDKATAHISYGSAETATVQSFITAIQAGSIAAYSTYTAYTTTYDSTDSIITSFKPADYFSISLNESRFDKSQELLDYTGCKRRVGNDGNIHIFDPVTTGTTYDEEYKFNVSGDHNFWGESVRLRFVNPNEERVVSHPDHSPSYSGTATSATSYALAPKTHTTYRRLTSDAQASSIASAIIERYELDAERGFVTVPMHVAQELWDYVKVTDSRAGGTTRVGNVQFIQRDVEVHVGRPITWQTMLSFGKVSEQSLAANMATAGLSEGGSISNAQMLELYNEFGVTLNSHAALLDRIVAHLNNLDTVPVWKVTQLLQVPPAGV